PVLRSPGASLIPRRTAPAARRRIVQTVPAVETHRRPGAGRGDEPDGFRPAPVRGRDGALDPLTVSGPLLGSIMFGIGDFARHGQVSVRMLRHYDAVGLLRPARVDPVSGYRFYEAAQLSRLNRIIALKDLGFTLNQVGSILDEQVSTEELRGMLRLRRAELEEDRAAAEARLAQVEARLRGLESEGLMSAYDVVPKPLPAAR